MRRVVRKVAAMEGGLVWFGGGFTMGMLFPDRWTCIWHHSSQFLCLCFTNNLRYCSNSWFIHSVCLSVCGWNTIDNLVSIPNILFNSFVLWNALTLTFFFLFYLFFLILYFFSFEFLFLFLFSDNEEARDIAVTWHVTWFDVISLEHSGRIWKMMSGHMYTTWQPWVGNEADMRL